MKRECDNYPDLNHENCILDPYETAVVEHFESQGFTVEKLCTAWLPDGEVVPDFRITDDEGWQCLCEVKKLTSSTGALSESDWKYANRMEFERLKSAAEGNNVRLIAQPDQIKLWKGEISRRVLSKCSELSAVAICKVSEICDISRSFGPFLVFHSKDPNIPSVLKHAFPDSSSIWF